MCADTPPRKPIAPADPKAASGLRVDERLAVGGSVASFGRENGRHGWSRGTGAVRTLTGSCTTFLVVDSADGYFDERVAARYDESVAELFDAEAVDAVVDFIAALAGSGRALELGIGTGRIGLPLTRRGVPVHGIELSRAMVERMRAKAGGNEIPVTLGDFATATAEGEFAVAYVVFNTIMNLASQAKQVACFRNVAAHLEPRGCFVVEVGVPELRLLPPGESFRVFRASESSWGIDEYDVAVQGLTSHHLEIVDGRLERFSTPFRYAWPSELDLMAQLAGLSLRERWGGWRREPFTGDSRMHVSVWERSA